MEQQSYMNEEKEEINMCKAFDDMLEEERMEGRIMQLIGLVKDDVISFEEAMKRSKLSKAEFEKYMDEIE